ncbi:MAG: hypothetical protein MHM6MM_002702 [Cercozoa sp. M6MM]
MDWLASLCKEIEATQCFAAELRAVVCKCAELFPQLKARVRCSRSGSLSRRLLKELHTIVEEKESSADTLNEETFALLLQLCIAVLHRVCSDASSSLNDTEVYTIIESLVARTLRIPRLHVRIIAKNCVSKKLRATPDHCERLLTVLQALQAKDVFDPTAAWVQDTRHVRQFLRTLQRQDATPHELSTSLELDPRVRTCRLLSNASAALNDSSERAQLFNGLIVRFQTDSDISHQATDQGERMRKQAIELHFQAVMTLSHYKWQYNTLLYDSSVEERHVLAHQSLLQEEQDQCFAFRSHLELQDVKVLKTHDDILETVVSSRSARILNRFDSETYRTLIAHLAREFLYRRNVPKKPHEWDLGLYRSRWNMPMLERVLKDVLHTLPVAPSAKDWHRVFTALREAPYERYFRPITKVTEWLIVLMTALDVMRHYLALDDIRRGLALVHPANRHCHSCWLRFAETNRYVEYSRNAHCELDSARDLCHRLQPPFFAFKNLTRFDDSTNLEGMNFVSPVGLARTLPSILKSRGFVASSSAIRKGVTQQPGQLGFAMCDSDTAVFDAVNRFCVLCAVTQDAKEWSASDLYCQVHLNNTARDFVVWMSTPTSPLYNVNIDVVCELFDWLFGVDFDNLKTKARRLLRGQFKHADTATVLMISDEEIARVFQLRSSFRKSMWQQHSKLQACTVTH